MNISVIIPAYNEENYIGATLQSIIDSEPSNLLEIIVVDNASTDATADIAAKYKQVRVVREPKKGLTRARQAGLDAALGDILVYIDADTIARKDWFAELNKEFETDKDIICLSGPYRYYGLPEFKNPLTKWWYHYWFIVWYWFADFFISHTQGYVVTGGNFAAKKQALLGIGGFDTKIEFYGEDTDIARRLNQFGKIKFSKDFWIATSARRFNHEGLVVTGFRYLVNYASVILFKKPVTKKYQDVR
ncbi:MAG: glycosyltransferase family A protein [Candidatus Doudnabacteria bacterium]|nr:glycosyltransferase family A protein [Candidatus Doudnabacteria bacterium]